jgi:hypothetical protein
VREIEGAAGVGVFEWGVVHGCVACPLIITEQSPCHVTLANPIHLHNLTNPPPTPNDAVTNTKQEEERRMEEEAGIGRGERRDKEEERQALVEGLRRRREVSRR